MKIFTKIAAFAVVAAALIAGNTTEAAFTRYLTVGSTGTDVSELQSILVSNGYLASGLPMGYFGALTKAAVMKWQAAVGLPATGYFGPMSIAKIGAGSTSTTGGSTSSNTGSTSGLKGGDGDFKKYDLLGSPDNKNVEEGETLGVMAFEFEADNSDLLVERTDLIVEKTAGTVKKPWKVLDTVELTVGGKKIASVDASDEDNWDEQDTDQYRLRLENIDYKVEDGKKVKVTVEVTVQDSIDSDETGSWDISIDDDGIRARNAEGIDVYEGDIADTRNFSVEEANAGALNITVDDDNNDDQEVEVSEDNTTDDVVIYNAQVESKDGDNEIDSVTVDIDSLGAADLSDMVGTLYLFIDGEEVGSESVSGSSDSAVFDDINVTIDDNQEVDFEVRADFEEQGTDEENYVNGSAVQVTDMTVDFIDAQDDDQTESAGTAGGEITLSLNALTVDPVSTSAGIYSSIENKGQFSIKFKVTAPSEEDIYIPNGAGTSTATSTGAHFAIYGSSNTSIPGTTSSAVLIRSSGGSD
ncbi:MAG: trimeric autotransporter adhesin, partial [Candidatus Parcubacteria bacterium]